MNERVTFSFSIGKGAIAARPASSESSAFNMSFLTSSTLVGASVVASVVAFVAAVLVFVVVAAAP